VELRKVDVAEFRRIDNELRERPPPVEDDAE
jgi:hypothetical protein